MGTGSLKDLLKRVEPVGDSNLWCPALGIRVYGSKPVHTTIVDSNSTRTESFVAIRPDPGA